MFHLSGIRPAGSYLADIKTAPMIADRIRRKRKDLGYSQEYMAQRLGISLSAYNRLENEETKLDIGRLQEVAGILEEDIEYFVRPDTIVINTHGEHSGGNGLHVVNHKSALPEDLLRTITERHDAHVRQLHQMNERYERMNVRLLDLLEKHLGTGT